MPPKVQKLVQLASAHSNATLPRPRVENGLHAPTRQQWEQLIAPAPGEGDLVEVGRRAGEEALESLADTRQRVDEIDFHAIDPYVATVASGVAAGRVEIPKGEKKIEVDVPDFYADKVELLLGDHNGPGAPLLVIFPGIHSSGSGGHANNFKKLALERGMNYLVMPNSLSEEMLEDKPLYNPGNPRVDALWSHQALQSLKEKNPELFSSVSVAGYSYGALQGANFVRLDEEGSDRLVGGGLAVVSPPENLSHSMRELDGLREAYREGSGSITQTGLEYKNHVRRHGYEGFLDSELSQRGPGTNITEIEMSDKYGSRDGLKEMIEIVDPSLGHNRLPRNTQEYKDANWWERHKLRQSHNQQLENFTYGEFSEGWMKNDPWLRREGLTPEQMAERYSFSEAIEAIEDTPVLALVSADDYILNPDDVAAMRELETGPLEVARVLEHGGHVGLTWNPQVQELIADFSLGTLATKRSVAQSAKTGSS